MSITGYVGANGSGKTLLAVEAAMKRAVRTGRPLYSTVPIDGYVARGWVVKWVPAFRVRLPVWVSRGKVRVVSKPLESWSQFLALEDADVLLDEVSALASSRDTMGLPLDVVIALQTLRHRDVTVTWTAPGWMRADVLLREVTADTYEVVPRSFRAVGGQAWANTYLSVVRRFSGSEESGDKKPTHKLSGRLVRLAGRCSFGAYPSRHIVVRLSEYVSVIHETCGLEIKRAKYCTCGAKAPAPKRPPR